MSEIEALLTEGQELPVLQLLTSLLWLEQRVQQGLDALLGDFDLALYGPRALSLKSGLLLPCTAYVDRDAIARLEATLSYHRETLEAQPQQLFACVYNSLYWYDASDYTAHTEGAEEISIVPYQSLHRLMESWREQFEGAGRCWVRALRPPTIQPADHPHRVIKGRSEPLLSRDGALFLVSHGERTELYDLSLTRRGSYAGAMATIATTRLAVYPTYSTAEVYALSREAPLFTSPSFDISINAVSLSYDEQRVAIASYNDLQIFSLESGARLLRSTERTNIKHLRFLRDGSLLILGHDYLERIAGTGEVLSGWRTSEGGYLGRPSFNREHTRVAFSDSSRALLVLRTEDLTEVLRAESKPDLESVELSPDGERVYTRSWGRLGATYQVEAGQELPPQSPPRLPGRGGLSRHLFRVAGGIIGGTPGHLCRWETALQRERPRLSLHKYRQLYLCAEEDKLLAAGNGEFVEWSLSSATQLSSTPGVILAQLPSAFLVTSGTRRQVSDLALLRQDGTRLPLQAGGGPLSIQTSIDKERLFVSNQEKQTRVFETRTGRELHCWEGELVRLLAGGAAQLRRGGAEGESTELVDAEGRHLFTARRGGLCVLSESHAYLALSDGREVEVWSVAENRRLCTFGKNEHEANMRYLRFLSDEVIETGVYRMHHITDSEETGSLRSWDLRSGALLSLREEQDGDVEHSAQECGALSWEGAQRLTVRHREQGVLAQLSEISAVQVTEGCIYFASGEGPSIYVIRRPA